MAHAQYLAATSLPAAVTLDEVADAVARVPGSCARAVRDRALIERCGRITPLGGGSTTAWRELVDVCSGPEPDGEVSVGFVAELREVLDHDRALLLLIDGPVPRPLGDALHELSNAMVVYGALPGCAS